MVCQFTTPILRVFAEKQRRFPLVQVEFELHKCQKRGEFAPKTSNNKTSENDRFDNKIAVCISVRIPCRCYAMNEKSLLEPFLITKPRNQDRMCEFCMSLYIFETWAGSVNWSFVQVPGETRTKLGHGTVVLTQVRRRFKNRGVKRNLACMPTLHTEHKCCQICLLTPGVGVDGVSPRDHPAQIQHRGRFREGPLDANEPERCETDEPMTS